MSATPGGADMAGVSGAGWVAELATSAVGAGAATGSCASKGNSEGAGVSVVGKAPVGLVADACSLEAVGCGSAARPVVEVAGRKSTMKSPLPVMILTLGAPCASAGTVCQTQLAAAAAASTAQREVRLRCSGLNAARGPATFAATAIKCPPQKRFSTGCPGVPSTGVWCGPFGRL